MLSKKNWVFKIIHPIIRKIETKRNIKFDILVNDKYKYLINFPLLFKFYGDTPYIASVCISYLIPIDNKKEILLEKEINFFDKTIEYELYITDIVVKKIVIEIDVDKFNGHPIIGFEILENNLSELDTNHTLEIKL